MMGVPVRTGTQQAIAAFTALAERLDQLAAQEHQAMVAAAYPAGLMKPVNLAAQLAATETELACLKMALAQVKEDRNELRRARAADGVVEDQRG